MTTDDDTTSTPLDDDLNLLVNMVIPVAVEHFAPAGRIHPFGAAIGTSGDQLHVTSDLGEDTHPDEVLAHLVDIARAHIDSFRAVAIVSLVRHGSGDGIRVVVDRREGAVSVVFPVSRKRLTKKVDLGEPSVAPASGWIWADADAAANPSAPGWRDETPQYVQDDFDALFAQLVPFAEQTLGRYGEMYPFGAAILRDGRHQLLGAETSEGEHPPSQELLNLLFDGARAEADTYRAFAVASDILANGSDALHIEAEHRDGIAISAVLPYTRNPATETISFAGGGTRLAAPRVWTK